MRILKELFALKWCKIRTCSELRIAKDLAWAQKKRQIAAAVGVHLPSVDCNLIGTSCQAKTAAGPLKMVTPARYRRYQVLLRLRRGWRC